MSEHGEEIGKGQANDANADMRSLQQQLDWSHARTRDLLDETRQHQTRNRELQAELLRHAREERRLTELLGRAEALVRGMEAGLIALRNSLSLQLGYMVLQSLRSVRGLLALPIRVFRLLRVARQKGSEQQAVIVPLPYEWFSSELRRDLEKFHEATSASPVPDHSMEARTKQFAELPQSLSEVRIAAVMDEFTFNSFRDCCEVEQLTPEGWQAELERIRPHLLFVESAWDGKDSTWLRKISGTSRELRELVAHCRRRGIPVVFWSKEDPVHFRTFLATARLADVVFTTDIDCITHYKAELGHDRVFLLPFAAQPLAHNPLERYQRRPGFCFAGSYYVRYPVRQRDFTNVIDAVSDFGAVDIYDRNHGRGHPNYEFPEQFHRYIVGNLSFDQIDVAYKGYDFGININTVKHSQSMFARRVFDLLASNTTVVSNYSRGLKLMFGELVVSGDASAQVAAQVAPLVQDPLRRRKHRLAGLRKIMGEHTYQDRLAYLLDKLYGDAPAVVRAEVVVLARVASEGELGRVLASFRRQSWEAKRLVLVFAEGFRPAAPLATNDVQVLSATQAQARRASGLARDTAYLAGFHPDDYYGPHYLTDLALAASYSPSPTLGKAAHYVMQSSTPVLIDDGAQYKLGAPVARRRGMTLGSQCDESVASWADGIDAAAWENGALAIDEFNYCANAPDLDHCAAVDDLELDPGLPLVSLLNRAEGIPAAARRKTSGKEPDGLPALAASELFESLGNPANKYLSATLEDQALVIQSTLEPEQHAYAYLAGHYTPRQLHCTDIARMQLVADRGDGLSLVLVFFDASGQKISHALVKSAANVTVAVPAGTHSVQVGIRVAGPGAFRISRLALEHVPLAVDMVVTRGRHLLIAKNYPSYDDLYKHAFVHRRAVEYARRLGVAVDVFRIGTEGLRFYEFDGIDVIHGQADHLRAILRSGSHESLLVHVLDERTWDVLQEFSDRYRVYIWAHGSEIQSASRRECDHVDEATRTRAIALGDRRMAFWRNIFREAHPNLEFVFVSAWSAADAMADIGVELPPESYRVIHNFIDTELFAYQPKPAAQRTRILSIRPFSSNVYANDLSVAAILQLSTRPFFDELEIRIVGDGPLFEATVAPLRQFPNVIIEQTFLTQVQIAALHRDYGVFLVPSRMDSQGVSRDEAMSSGLVPVTNRVAAIPEFVDDACGLLVEPDDASGLAAAIERIYHDPALFERLSAAAAARVRAQCGYEATIAREIALFDTAPGR